MTKNDIIKYVMDTPENTNPSVLNSMLEEMESGSGGNSNYVETIEGTLANPWGSVDPAALYAQLQDGEVSVLLNITVPSEGRATFLPSPTSDWWWFSAVITYDPDSHVVTQAMYLEYLVSGELNLGYLYKDGTATDMSGLAARFPTILTIIHHPLPNSES